MPKIEVIVVPQAVNAQHVQRRVACVVDAMRSTTATLAALHAGAREVRLFPTHEKLLAADENHGRASVVLAGEIDGKVAGDMDMGSSPDDFTADRVAGKVVLIHSANGSAALAAAMAADTIYIAAMANVSAIAALLAESSADIVFICGGYNGQVADEDLFVAGAIIDRLLENPAIECSASATFARELFNGNRTRAREVFARGQAGMLLAEHGLVDDIATCAELDVFPVVGIVDHDPPRIRSIPPAS